MLSDIEDSASFWNVGAIESRWIRLLIDWVNKCASPKTEARHLTPQTLLQVVNRYKGDICRDDLDRAMLCTDDIEPFLKYKYPILRLGYYTEMKDLPRKHYIMHLALLYCCCVSSVTGQVYNDICDKLERDEQEAILKFCEYLSEIEVTLSNVETAASRACETMFSIANTNSKCQAKRPTSSYDESFLNSSNSTMKLSAVTISSNATLTDLERDKTLQNLKFKSSVTVMPSAVVTDTSSMSKTSIGADNIGSDQSNLSTADTIQEYKNTSGEGDDSRINKDNSLAVFKMDRVRESRANVARESGDKRNKRCKAGCKCDICASSGPCCGDPGSSYKCYETTKTREPDAKTTNFPLKWLKYFAIAGLTVMTFALVVALSLLPLIKKDQYQQVVDENMEEFVDDVERFNNKTMDTHTFWQCNNNLCEIVKKLDNKSTIIIFLSLSRCTLICMGPQLWPHPTGQTVYGKTLAAFSNKKFQYKFQSVPSEPVQQMSGEALKLFIKDLAKLQNTISKKDKKDLDVIKMILNIEIGNDVEPKLRLSTDESYSIKIDTNPYSIVVKIIAKSFCGFRHGLETLSQLILIDQRTGYLIIPSEVTITDAPKYKYRGLMIDTARNYIPLTDLLRTVDAMGMNKLNTFHWRITDVTSFPLLLKDHPELFEYGGYDRSMVYTRTDVETVVRRATVRGVRVLIEVAAPGPVGRAWIWTNDASCPRKENNLTCDNNVLCKSLKLHDTIFDILEDIYRDIIEMTSVDDVFHLSDNMFSIANCYRHVDTRSKFLVKASARLKIANGGVMPKLPVVWYAGDLTSEAALRVWEFRGVQLHEWPPTAEESLAKLKVIHSSKWDLSCEMRSRRCWKYRTWQQMYTWMSWRNLEAYATLGGEALLWTDLVNSGNLDYHLWPRASAVAERLWSDGPFIRTSNDHYLRLDSHRNRMTVRGVSVQPIWPAWCCFHPGQCLNKVQ